MPTIMVVHIVVKDGCNVSRLSRVTVPIMPLANINSSSRYGVPMRRTISRIPSGSQIETKDGTSGANRAPLPR